jgi:hypothetical protein
MTFNVLVFLLVFIPLQSLGGIDYTKTPPADWPSLTVREHYMTPAEVTKECMRRGAGLSLACADAQFNDNTCDIIFPNDPPRWMYEHEHAHCKGYDHVGDSIMQNDWALHKKMLLDMKPSESK